MPKEKSCGAVVFRREDEPKFLLLHYAGGHWDFPKGHVEGSESEEQTAQRELREETGIFSATLIPSFRETLSYFHRFNNETFHKEVVFFLMETTEKNVTLSDEHIGFEWLGFDDAKKRITFENSRGVLTKAKNYL